MCTHHKHRRQFVAGGYTAFGSVIPPGLIGKLRAVCLSGPIEIYPRKRYTLVGTVISSPVRFVQLYCTAVLLHLLPVTNTSSSNPFEVTGRVWSQQTLVLVMLGGYNPVLV